MVVDLIKRRVKFGVRNAPQIFDAATAAAQAYGAYQTAKGLQQQNRQLKRQEAAQQEADRKAQAEKAHSEREMRYRSSARRRSQMGVRGYSPFPGGYHF